MYGYFRMLVNLVLSSLHLVKLTEGNQGLEITQYLAKTRTTFLCRVCLCKSCCKFLNIDSHQPIVPSMPMFLLPSSKQFLSSLLTFRIIFLLPSSN